MDGVFSVFHSVVGSGFEGVKGVQVEGAMLFRLCECMGVGVGWGSRKGEEGEGCEA